jgi:hypothetical protein
MRTKPDLVITTACGYRWEQIRPFVISLGKSGFGGDKVLLASKMDVFALECATNRNFNVIPFDLPKGTTTWTLASKERYVPLLKFLGKNRRKYNNVVWADVSDLIFQSDPSEWMAKHVNPPMVIAARECWRIQDETQFNDPWVKAAFPDDYEWLRKLEVLCGGTLAGDAETVFQVLLKVFEITSEHPEYADQAVLNYVLHKPFHMMPPTHIYTPSMSKGWAATCSAFDTEGFKSIIGQPASSLTDEVPVFDQERGLVLTPDGKTPFVIVHQYNRATPWVQSIPAKYQWD